MKALLKITGLFILTLFVMGNSFAQNNMNMYKAKSGLIEYKMSGKTTGTETLYFDNHGSREARFTETKTKMLGMTTTEKTLSIRLDSIMYSIDLEEKTGTRMVIPFDPSKMTEKELKEWEEWGKQMMDEMGFEKIGEGEVLGKKCDIWEGMGSKVWIWQNLTLKSEVNLMGKWVTEATKIDLNINISSDKFKVPDGIRISEGSFDFDTENSNEDVDYQLDSTATDLGKELEKGLNDLKGILGVKKKKKKK